MPQITYLLERSGLRVASEPPAFKLAVYAAEAVANTIDLPIPRAAFEARAAGDIYAIGRLGFDRHVELLKGVEEAADAARKTPLGSTELWGDVMQAVSPPAPPTMNEFTVIVGRPDYLCEDNPLTQTYTAHVSAQTWKEANSLACQEAAEVDQNERPEDYVVVATFSGHLVHPAAESAS